HAYHRTFGKMSDNIHNLSAEAVEELTALYAGTNLGVQELDGILVEDVEGALLTSAVLQKWRVDHAGESPALRAMAIDPAFSENPLADEVGIIIGQRLGNGTSAIGEVLADASRRGTPGSWS